jgi:hypothetical protein
LYCLNRKADFSAGLAVSLIAVKPQVMLLFAVALVIWILRDRRWRVAAGGLCGLAALTAVVLIPNPQVFAMYAEAMAHRGPTGFMPPTPGTLLRVLSGGEFWPSLVPLAIGLAWLGWRLARRGRDWHWSRELPLLTFACFLASPYAWAYDLAIVLVPLTQAAVMATSRGRTVRIAFFGVCLGVTAAALAMNLVGRQEYEFAWLAPVLLGVYLWFQPPASLATWSSPRYRTAASRAA